MSIVSLRNTYYSRLKNEKMNCPTCKAESKFVRTYETIQNRNSTIRRKFCQKCGGAWITEEHSIAEYKSKKIEKREREEA
ncbi:MAG: hypothetical protein JSS63_02520 [Bacteroidetes bacterium]|nr:hypothetical protein [Bacteroidota bacterium]